MAESTYEKQETTLEQICTGCGKRVDPAAGSSLTGWLFRHNRCQCAAPAILAESTPDRDGPSLHLLASAQDIIDRPLDSARRYKALELIGQGGMGAVYRAQDSQTGDSCAIKILRKELVSDEQAVDRFKQEADATMRLTHPNIVKVLDFGFTADAAPFLVMEYISGDSLQALLARKGSLDAGSAAAIFQQVCDALSYVHSQHLLHRDLKPSNIIISSNESGQVARIVDFGIAKAIVGDLAAAHGPTLTRTDELVGSPPYMSPEQCMGQQLDIRSDIYSLGCSLYQALSGRLPFEGDNPVQVIVKHLHRKPVELSKIGVDKTLSAIVSTCMSKDPEDRYQSCAQLKDDLARFQNGQTLQSRPLTQRLRSMYKRIGTKAVLALTAIIVAASALTYFEMSKHRLGTRTGPATDTLWRQLYREGQDLLDQGNTVEAGRSFRESLKIARELHEPRLVLASLYECLDLDTITGNSKNATIIKDEISRLNQDDATAEAIARELASSLKQHDKKESDPVSIFQLEELCSRANDKAAQLINTSKLSSAEALLRNSRKLAETALSPEHPIVARCLANLAILESQRAERRKAAAIYRDVLARLSKMGSSGLAMMARVYTNLGWVDDAGAEACFQKSEKINAACYGPGSPQLAWSRFQLADYHAHHGKSAQAKEEVKSVIASYEKAGNPDPYWLARAYALQGELEGNQELCSKALATLEDQDSRQYMSIARLLIQMANIAISHGDSRQAENYLARATAIRQRTTVAGWQDAIDLDLYEAKAAMYDQEHKPELAEEFERKSLSERNKRANPYRQVCTLNNLSKLVMENGKKAESAELNRQAIKLLDQDVTTFDDKERLRQELTERYKQIKAGPADK